jgi:uncharacterized protein YqgV (UPF0045/DUF77 family)
MNLSVEVSMYPLQDGYKAMIKEFLAILDTHRNVLEFRTSNMSTRIFGDYDSVTNLLNLAMKKSIQDHGKIVFVCKYLEGDARDLSSYD